MAEENNQNWNKKKVLMALIGAVVLGTVAGIQDATQQFIKSLFSPAAPPEAKNPPKVNENPSIKIGKDAQGVIIGNHNTQHNTKNETHYHGISIEKYEKLVKELGITEAALKNLFKTLELQNVPPEELDNALRKLAEKHKELEKRAALLESDDPEVNKLQQQAREAIDKADYETAEGLLDKAAELDNEAADKVHEIYVKRKRSAAGTLALKAETLHTRFKLTESARAYEQAIQYAQQGEDEVKIAEYRNSLGSVLHDDGKYQLAIDQYQLALASHLKTYGEDHPDVARDRNNLGEAWKQLGQYQKAIGYYEKALSIFVKKLGDEHPHTRLVKSNLEKARQALLASNSPQ